MKFIQNSDVNQKASKSIKIVPVLARHGYSGVTLFDTSIWSIKLEGRKMTQFQWLCAY